MDVNIIDNKENSIINYILFNKNYISRYFNTEEYNDKLKNINKYKNKILYFVNLFLERGANVNHISNTYSYLDYLFEDLNNQYEITRVRYESLDDFRFIEPKYIECMELIYLFIEYNIDINHIHNNKTYLDNLLKIRYRYVDINNPERSQFCDRGIKSKNLICNLIKILIDKNINIYNEIIVNNETTLYKIILNNDKFTLDLILNSPNYDDIYNIKDSNGNNILNYVFKFLDICDETKYAMCYDTLYGILQYAVSRGEEIYLKEEQILYSIDILQKYKKIVTKESMNSLVKLLNKVVVPVQEGGYINNDYKAKYLKYKKKYLLLKNKLKKIN